MQLIWTFAFLNGRIFYRCDPFTPNSPNSGTVLFTQIIQIFPASALEWLFFKSKALNWALGFHRLICASINMFNLDFEKTIPSIIVTSSSVMQ